MSIEKLFDMWRNDEILKYYVICAAVSALSWLSQFCTSKKKHWNRLRENSKIRHFVISSHLFYWHANHISKTAKTRHFFLFANWNYIDMTHKDTNTDSKLQKEDLKESSTTNTATPIQYFNSRNEAKTKAQPQQASSICHITCQS